VVVEAKIGQLLEHARWVRGLARCLTSDDADADDLAQDAWVAALRHPPQETTRGWLGAVMRNARRMALRGDRRRIVRERATLDPDARVESAADLADEVELGRVLAEELLALPVPYRETLLLTFYRDLSSAEIGAQRGIPAATVRGHLRVGLERLRRRLDARYGERAAWKRALVPLAILPRVVARGAVMVKATTAAIAAVGVLGIVAAQHARPEVPTSTARAPSASPASGTTTALERRIETLRAQRPAHDALRARIEARQPPRLPPTAPPGSSGRADEELPAALETGGLDPEYIRQAIEETLPLFKACFEDALLDEPSLHGRLMLSFTIEGDPDVGGIVSTSKVDDDKSTLHQPALKECFEQSIYAARFPAPSDHGAVEVSYPFALLDDPDSADAATR